LIYRWGGEPKSQTPIADLRLPRPWSAWRLTYADVGGSPTIGLLDATPLIASLVVVVMCLTTVGVYLMTSLRRQMVLATQRVNFASHVSHELRTPLTNIRLYAELAKRDLQNGQPQSIEKAGQRLRVIDEESRRLTRIVSGVLDLVSGKAKLHLAPRIPDAVIRSAINGFAPSFQQLGITADLSLAAGRSVNLDADLVDLALVNLFSNVEKYIARGGTVSVISTQNQNQTIVDVIDDGPGVKRSQASKIFQPFVRIDDSIDAPAGTGLGLSIARNAARRHGGDLVLLPSKSGCHFRLTIAHPS